MENDPSEVRKYFDNLTEPDFNALWKRLRLITYKKHGWLLRKVRGLNLEELMQDSIVDAYLGIRNCPSETPILAFLYQTVRSKIYQVIKADRRKMPIVDCVGEEEHESGEVSLNELIINNNIIKEIEHKQVCKQLLSSVRGDHLVFCILSIWIKRPDLKPQEIASILDLPVEDIRNAQKRLRTRAQHIRRNGGNI